MLIFCAAGQCDPYRMCVLWTKIWSSFIYSAVCSFHMQCAVCSLQCTVCTLQCAVCNVSYSKLNVQCAMCSVYFEVFSLQLKCAVRSYYVLFAVCIIKCSLSKLGALMFWYCSVMGGHPPYNTTLHCTALHYSILHCSVLNCTKLY